MTERPSNVPPGTLDNILAASQNETYIASVEAAKRVHAGYEAQTAAETKRANTDALTGLLNKGALKELMANRIKSGESTGELFGLIFIDLKDFKKLNDSLGHDAGDKYLQDAGGFIKDIASVLQRTLRTKSEGDRAPDILANEVSYVSPDDDTNEHVGRFGGDEFLAMVEGVKTTEDMETVKKRILDSYNAEPKLVDSGVGLSVGIEVWRPGMTQEELLAAADASMYAHKEEQKAVVGSHR